MKVQLMIQRKKPTQKLTVNLLSNLATNFKSPKTAPHKKTSEMNGESRLKSFTFTRAATTKSKSSSSKKKF